MDAFWFCLIIHTIFSNWIILFCNCDTFRIGKRAQGDSIILKKVLLSIPTQIPTNHTMIYEYKATNAVTCMEYQVENISDNEKILANIEFTGEYSLNAKFEIYNITELVIVMSVYGFVQFEIPPDFQPILVPQFLHTQDDNKPKFGLGLRQSDDELIYFYAQSSKKTNKLTNHSLDFNADLEHYITYASFSVDSKSAGVTFLAMTDHTFNAIVYDVNTHILFANLYIYGYKLEKLPDNYELLFPKKKTTPTPSTSSSFSPPSSPMEYNENGFNGIPWDISGLDEFKSDDIPNSSNVLCRQAYLIFMVFVFFKSNLIF